MELEGLATDIRAHADGLMLSGRIDAVGLMVFNHVQRHNALTPAMWDAVADILDGFDADDTIRVVVLAGAGSKAFISGGDIGGFAGSRANAQQDAAYRQQTGRGRDRLASFPKPTIACIKGWCLGGGMATALDCDLRVAARGTVMGIPAARVGLAYGSRQLQRMVAIVGTASARRIMYTAERIDAVEAFRLGLVDKLVEDERVVEESLALARTIAANAPLSVRSAKLTLEELVRDPALRDPQVQEAIGESVRRCMDSRDYAEGRQAFAEKRAPRFEGR